MDNVSVAIAVATLVLVVGVTIGTVLVYRKDRRRERERNDAWVALLAAVEVETRLSRQAVKTLTAALLLPASQDGSGPVEVDVDDEIASR